MGISCYFQLHDHRREQGNKRKLLLSKGEGRQCATRSLSSAFQYRGVNLNAWNRRPEDLQEAIALHDRV